MSGIRFSPAGALALFAATLVLVPSAQAAERHHAGPAHKTAHKTAPKAAPPGVETLGSAGAWMAYASQQSNGRVCYLAGEPKKQEPAGAARKAAMAMVTHRPGENISNVVSFVEGYPLKPGSDVVLDVDGRKFELFTKDDSAWARTSELDRTIVAALARGKSVVARGEPQRGRATTDAYSLAGFSKALAMIDKACGIKREKPAAPHRAAHPRSASRKATKHKATKHPTTQHRRAERKPAEPHDAHH